MSNPRHVLALAMAVAVLTAVHGLMPAAVKAQPSPSVDERLLDELNTDPLDEIDRELFGPGKEQGRAGGPSGKGGEDLRDRLRGELGAAADPEDDPLLSVARTMRRVEGLIAKNDSSPATQDLQQQIITDLSALIQQARKRCSQGKPGSKPGSKASSKAGRPRPSDSPAGPPRPKKGSGGGKQPGPTVAFKDDQPNPARAPVRHVDVGQVQEAIRQLWGVLPERQREQMTQPPTEEFLPKYEWLIEEYFRRLLEEKDTGTD